MYPKVLVPLDGSKLAEGALTHVKTMVQEGFVREVILLNVVRVDAPYSELYGAHFDLNKMKKAYFDAAGKYLANMQARLVTEGIQVKTEVVEHDRPAPAITDYAAKNGIDLIVIATHGYTGLKKLMLGSVALSILHHSRTPVLLIRPEAIRL
jgi:nucleotide-binding universal stress UspA family protein